MPVTRRSTRQSVASASTPTEPTSPPAPTRRKATSTTTTKPTRQKRARSQDEDVEPAPPKKATKVAPAKKAGKAAKSAPPKTDTTKPAPIKDLTQPAPTAPTTTTPPPPTPPNTHPTNRDATGHQQVYWLFKSEPTPRYENGHNISFSLSDLSQCNTPEPWSGVRNFAARNNMLAMRRGDLGFFYHSNAKPSGIVGVVRVVSEAAVDATQFDAQDPYFDAKSSREKPKWWCVGVEFVGAFREVVELAKIKELAAEKGGVLEKMELVRLGRLSVCRVERGEWEFILGLVGGMEGLVGAEEMGKGEGAS